MMSLKAVAHWKLKWVTILYQKKYQNGTKIGRFFCSRGGGEHGKCQICTLNHEKCTDLVLFWLHTQIDKKKKQSVVLQ